MNGITDKRRVSRGKACYICDSTFSTGLYSYSVFFLGNLYGMSLVALGTWNIPDKMQHKKVIQP